MFRQNFKNLWPNEPSKLDTNYHSFRLIESENYFPTIIEVPWKTRCQNSATKRQFSQLLKCSNRVGFMYCDFLIYWRTVKETLTCPRSVYFRCFDLVMILSAVVQSREIHCFPNWGKFLTGTGLNNHNANLAMNTCVKNVRKKLLDRIWEVEFWHHDCTPKS